MGNMKVIHLGGWVAVGVGVGGNMFHALLCCIYFPVVVAMCFLIFIICCINSLIYAFWYALFVFVCMCVLCAFCVSCGAAELSMRDLMLTLCFICVR